MRSNVFWEPHFAVCRIFVGQEFRGHGFVVPYGDIAFACAHSLVGRPAKCFLRFPALQGEPYRGVLDECSWFEDEDIAILRVEPPIHYPCAGLALRLPHERPQQCYSFILPDHYSDGNHVYLKLGGRDTSHRHQLHPEHAPHDAYEIEPGCSGAPVFDLLGNAVWGMIVAVDASGKRIAKAIPADVLWDAFERFRKCMEERHGRRLSSLRVPEPPLADPAREVIAAATETVERTEPEESLGAKIVDWFRDGLRSLLALSWCAGFRGELERALAGAREGHRFDALANLLERGPEAAPGALAVLSRSERTSHLLARGAVRFSALRRETAFPAGEGGAGVWRLPVRGKLARFVVAPAVASALQSWQEAVELADDDPWPRFALGRACHRAGYPLEAIALLIRAAETVDRAERSLPEGITERLLDEFGFAVLDLAPAILADEELTLAFAWAGSRAERYALESREAGRRATLAELLRRFGEGPEGLAEVPTFREARRPAAPAGLRIPTRDMARAVGVFALWLAELADRAPRLRELRWASAEPERLLDFRGPWARKLIRELAWNVPDERTRALLERRAVEDESVWVRRGALEALAESFPDERTRALLERRAVEDQTWWVRRGALEALAGRFPDERTRALLERRAVEDPQGRVRSEALGALARHFPDERTRDLLERRAVEDPDDDVRREALEALARRFPDERTRDFIRWRIKEDPESLPNPDALGALAARFPEQWIRDLLERRAVEDENMWVRRGALGALAERFPDERTRSLLERRAVEDPNKWPRQRARELLERFDRGKKADD